MSSVEPVTVIAGAYTKIPCMEFTEDSANIIFASSEDTIEIKNFLGETLKTISCKDKINSFRLAEDKKHLLFLQRKISSGITRWTVQNILATFRRGIKLQLQVMHFLLIQKNFL